MQSSQVAGGAPSEVEEIFDTITYNKGACIVRMLYNWIGAEVRCCIHLAMTFMNYIWIYNAIIAEV